MALSGWLSVARQCARVGVLVGLPSAAAAGTAGWVPAPVFWWVVTVTAILVAAIAGAAWHKRQLARHVADSQTGKDKLSAILDSVEACIYIKSPDLHYQYVNRKTSELLGLPPRDIIGKTDRDFFDTNTVASLHLNDRRVIEGGEKVVAEEGRVLCAGGREHTFLSVKLPLRNPDGSIQSLCGISTDITEYREIRESNHRLTYFDPLTGLPNRRLLLDRLEMVVKGTRRSNRYAGLLFIDLDNFKVVNDTQGLHEGDQLLRRVADRLSQVVRESDTLARLGADEFVLLLHDLDSSMEQAAQAAERVAEKLLARVLDTLPVEERALTLPITGSVGIALFAGARASVDGAMQQADMALQQAKGAGGNTLRFFNPEMQAAVMARVHLEADLHQALARDELRLHYQIQVDSQSRVTGVEALLRWQHPQRGMVAPGQFIPLAERTRLILPIGHWVLESACRQLATWAKEPALEALSISVNVSSIQFHQQDFVARVRQVLASTAANPNRLILEVTESLLMEEPERVREIMLRLNELGIRFALDDFGTGFSSLNYLKRLPLDALKIDQSFIKGVLTDPVDAAIVQATITLAASLGLAVTAEGVETEEQHQWLQEHDCKAFQGYLFGRPLAVGDLRLGQRHGLMTS
ncbi:putative bifunctional diguanylate cyclase/phosphodiesterase [Billgrantia endophytica]|uniref:cyclic-guanylate-specific phosphodiesterase n=1 Tax=Billgrantia endophytica TaxID=2033802 RepID=A0A2N7UB14_9GAMM|nr:GGDEF domain-containing phosphodiesterase [Halomonas endophytica]PMR77633.1 GGDEF domain-containing protein [Halomonas endophytica]